MRPGAGLYYIICAGTGMCVHIPFRLNPIASWAWLGKQLPCPLQHNEVLHLYRSHLKDRISSMSLFIPNRVSELILLFTCLVQKGRLCPHWTKVAEMGKYGKMRNGLRFLELFMHMIKITGKSSKSLDNERTSWPTAGTSGWSALISHPRP